ncbi:hypothetical protein P3T26_004365 [Streptomyces sp. MAA16]|nr:hypothetical protein [Streptomyces sp. MAA16]
MDRYGYLALWCAAFGVAALVGYGRSLTGTSGAQRAVRVMGRIERMREPRHGGVARRRDTGRRLLPRPVQRAGVHRDERR